MLSHELLSDEEKLVLKTARSVAGAFGRKYWLEKWSKNEQPLELWEKMRVEGLTGTGVPEELGGSGMGLISAVLVQEGLALEGLPVLQYLVTHFSRDIVIKAGTTEQAMRFVRPTCTDGKRMSFGLTEPQAGSNTWRITTFARREERGYVLRGQKVFISGAKESDFMLVVARTKRYNEVKDKRDGISLFVVETDSPNIRFERLNIDTKSPEWQYLVYFDDVEVPPDNLIGRENDGYRALFEGLNVERLMIAAIAVGLGSYALSKAVEYAKQRVVFDVPIGSHQGVQFPLARAAINLEAARSLIYSAARLYDNGSGGVELANAAKYIAAEAALEAIDAAVQTFGGYAYEFETDIMNIYSIARVLKTAPVTNELVLNYIATHVLKLPKSY
ncbi:MAG: acyl-CoA dehydrogenase family protein [Nitrososphaerota archaeon]|nr:acyl-CoA dehydrogenase family protein [Nitrososphaerota archaeon]